MKNRILFGLLIMSLSLFAQNKNKGTVMLKEGAEGVYILLGNQRITNTDRMNEQFVGAIIYRAIGNEKFKEIGQLKPAASPSEFKALLDNNVLKKLAELKKLKSESEAWEYIQQHPNLNDYGLLSMNINFGVAMGAYYLDRDVIKMKATDVRYQVRYLMKDGTKAEPLESAIRLGLPADIPPPKFVSKIETDSFVVVKWFLPAKTAPEAVFAKVFRSTGNSGKYEAAGTIFAMTNQPRADSVTFIWEENVKHGYAYSYFIQPATMAFLAGNNSDTVTVVSTNFSGLQQITDLNASDSLQGILLTWKQLPNSAVYSGLVVQRSFESVGPYIIIDTLPSVSVRYLDTKIKPNQSYYYRLQAITIRGGGLAPSDYTLGVHKNNSTTPDAPRNLTINTTVKGRVLKWNKNLEYDLAGYYVLRSSATENKEAISLLLNDTSFIDTAALYSRNTYYYEVIAYNNNNSSSEPSNRVSYQPDVIELPRIPGGIKGYAEENRITLAWDDIMQLDKFIKGYNVYQNDENAAITKENNTVADLSKMGFRKVNEQLLSSPSYSGFTDAASVTCCVTTFDVYGKESYASSFITLSPAKATYMPPSNVTARKISKGIEVNWDKSMQTGVTQYTIYRRTAKETTAARISSVDAAKESYVDTTVKSGITYYYSVTISGENLASEKSLEAGVAY